MSSRDECRLPGCDRPPGEEDTDTTYRTSRFCSVKHDVKFEHLKADARDAERSEREGNGETIRGP